MQPFRPPFRHEPPDEPRGVMHPNISKIAVFDVDRTLIRKTSGEVQLIRFLRKHKKLPWTNLFRSIGGLIRRLPRGISEAIFKNRVYLYGMRPQELKKMIPSFFEEYIRPKLHDGVHRYMQTLRERGYEIVFISGTLDCILDHLMDHFGADGGVGSAVEVREGRYTGWIHGNHPYRRGKVTALHRYLEGRDVDLDESYSFADSWSDRHLLRLFGKPVVVDPGRRLRRAAVQNGWDIL